MMAEQPPFIEQVEPVSLEWRKSSFSAAHAQDCVELAFLSPENLLVRDSKNPEGPRLGFDSLAFSALVELTRVDAPNT